MILDDIIEKIEEAQNPPCIDGDIIIGNETDIDKDIHPFKFILSQSNCTAFSHIKEDEDAYVFIHTHGIVVSVGDIDLSIHNSQIIVFDYYYFDDNVHYKKSEGRGEKILCGMVLGGPVGAAIGLAASFGKGTRHLVYYDLIIAFWNFTTKQKEFITLRDYEDLNKRLIPNTVQFWKLQVKINEETGREPKGDNKVGVEKGTDFEGCFWVCVIVLQIIICIIISLR